MKREATPLSLTPRPPYFPHFFTLFTGMTSCTSPPLPPYHTPRLSSSRSVTHCSPCSYKPIVAKVMEVFRPGAVVLQCGADSLCGFLLSLPLLISLPHSVLQKFCNPPAAVAFSTLSKYHTSIFQRHFRSYFYAQHLGTATVSASLICHSAAMAAVCSL
jgi:hypothetical protein